jgi:glycosyltransferase involved in cell wall biosynthesis
MALDRFAGSHLQDAVVGVSQALSSDLRRKFGATRVAFVPNGIDIDLVRKAGLSTSPHSRPIRIGLVGRMVPVKRVDVFLMVAEELTRRDPERFKFMLIGDGPLLAKLKESASNRGLVNVDFLGFREDSLRLIGELDILMITSDHEGLPMVVLESLALGVPVIAHAVGGLNEVITSSLQGRLVPSQNAQALADAVQCMAASLSDKSESLLPTRFDIVATANEYTRLYDRLLARKPLNHS